jgi:hypothetical protein
MVESSTAGAADPLATQLWSAFKAVADQVEEQTLAADWEQVKPALTESLQQQAVREDVTEYVLTCLEQDAGGPMATLTEVTEGRSTLLYDVAAAYAEPENEYAGVAELFDQGHQQGQWAAQQEPAQQEPAAQQASEYAGAA